ncbi:PfkB family carbohydrate kinase [Bacillus timonensis]|uniref:PfkB family carbohydrate kinase n=1 Tax=Bacillus timonensis TaxID=1033734 RepID=UPI000289BB96|nr:PfkB family carbohydrate kinase [Bacillus timonensis]
MKVIAIGDNVVDCYLDQGLYYPGGNAVNVAVNCKRSGAEEVGYIGVFATDDKAQHLKDVLSKEGISYQRSRVVEGKSGQPRVNLTEEGDRVFVFSPKDTVQHLVKIRLVEGDYDYIKTFDVCHTSCYSWLEDELPILSKQIDVSFDFSENRDSEYLQKVCPYISIGFFSGASLSDDEIENLLAELKGYNLKVIGITRGSKPAIFVHNGKRYEQEVLETEVVDTMGAGDSFIGAFLTAFYNEKSMEESLYDAAKSASTTCTFYGGFGYPNKLE